MRLSDDNWAFHILPIISMLLIMLVNQLVAGVRAEKRSGRELQGLRQILRLEMTELGRVYAENLRHLAARDVYLVAGRSFLTVSKGNMGRFPMLEPDVVERVVAVMASNERLESTLGRYAKIVGNSYRIDAQADCLDDIGEQLRQGCETVRQALDALRDDPVAKPLARYFKMSFGNRFVAVDVPTRQKPVF